jgi:copper(I)-binding protein
MSWQLGTFSKLLAFGIISMGGAAQAHDVTAGSLKIGHPWVQVVPGLSGGAGYLTVTNAGPEADRLLGATVNGTAPAEIHSMSGEGGRMRPVKEGLEIKPGRTLTLAPGAYHFMLPDLQGPFVSGALLKGVIQFQKAGAIPVEFAVEPVSSQKPAHHGH